MTISPGSISRLSFTLTVISTVILATAWAIAPSIGQAMSSAHFAAAPGGEPQPASALPEPVSIARINDDLFAVVDYQTLRLWRPSQATFSLPRLVKPPGLEARISGPLVEHWHPSGVHFHNGRLYVANYIFHDVLVFELNAEASALSLVDVLRAPDMVSPENVAAGAQGVAVADYDASGVFFFTPDGRLAWQDVGLPLAHGVAMDDAYVYVTTLAGSRKLLRYTLEGRREPVDADFSHLLYPTHLAVSRDAAGGARLIVLDANRGTLSFYDGALRKTGEIGALGPHAFNRPYGFVETRAGFVLTDTKNHRLVDIDPSGAIAASFPFAAVRHLGARARWGRGYAYCSDSKIESPVFSTQFDQYVGFDIICTTRGARVFSMILLPHRRATGDALRARPTPGFAFAWQGVLNVDGRRYWLVGSPTSNVVMISDWRGDYVFATHEPTTKVWSVEGAQDHLAALVRSAAPAFARQRRLARECSRLWAFLDAGAATQAATLDAQLRAVVEFPEARRSVERWLAGRGLDDPAPRLLREGQTSFDDLRLLGLLAASDAARERQVWTLCQARARGG
jgi:hypothetical protein